MLFGFHAFHNILLVYEKFLMRQFLKSCFSMFSVTLISPKVVLCSTSDYIYEYF